MSQSLQISISKLYDFYSCALYEHHIFLSFKMVRVWVRVWYQVRVRGLRRYIHLCAGTIL